MPIQLTVHECTLAEMALHRLSEIPLKAKTAYHIAKLLKLVKAEVKLYTQARNKYIMEIGTKRDPTDQEKAAGAVLPVTEVMPENREAFGQKDEEMLLVEVSLDYAPLALADLPQDMTAADLFSLGPLVVDTPPLRLVEPV